MNDTKNPRPFFRRLAGVLLGAGLLLGVLCFGPSLLDDMKLDIRESVTIEAGDHFPWPDDFLAENDSKEADMYFVSDVSAINTRIPGTYSVTLRSGNRTYSSQVQVVDSIAPTGQVRDLQVLCTELPQVTDFLLWKKDATETTVSYKTQPDFQQEGEQDVTILLTDLGGNVTELPAKLTIIFDTEAPVIQGIQNILVYQGDAVAYRSGITVTDDRDPNPQLTIDNSAVDLSTPGTYTVVYTATDYTGNTTTVSARVTVREKQPDYVSVDLIYSTVDSILTSIISDSMTNVEKVRACARWIWNNCTFVGTSVKDDWLQAAYRMMHTGQGDCYNYFAVMKLMLERLGMPTIDVVKVPNSRTDSNHYWSLVSVDGGNTYYHVDTTPRTDPENFILVTDAFMDTYSAEHKNCFNRDKSLYPATPREPVQ